MEMFKLLDAQLWRCDSLEVEIWVLDNAIAWRLLLVACGYYVIDEDLFWRGLETINGMRRLLLDEIMDGLQRESPGCSSKPCQPTLLY